MSSAVRLFKKLMASGANASDIVHVGFLKKMLGGIHLIQAGGLEIKELADGGIQFEGGGSGEDTALYPWKVTVGEAGVMNVRSGKLIVSRSAVWTYPGGSVNASGNGFIALQFTVQPTIATQTIAGVTISYLSGGTLVGQPSLAFVSSITGASNASVNYFSGASQNGTYIIPIAEIANGSVAQQFWAHNIDFTIHGTGEGFHAAY